MSLSRYDNPAQQNVQNTYVPIPYAELAHSLNVKQHEYDFLKDATDKADNEIQALKAPQFIRTSTDFTPNGVVENPQYNFLKQKQEELDSKKQDLLSSGIDFTTPDGKKAISQYIREASNFYNKQGRQIQQDSLGIEEHNKNHDEYLKKGVEYQGNAFHSDNNVENFLKTGIGFEKTSLNPYTDRQEEVRKALEPMKSQIISIRGKDGFVTLKDRETGAEVATIQNGKTIWKGVSGERVKNALNAVIDSKLDTGLQREAASHSKFRGGDYEKKYSKSRKDLQDYALNTFISTDVTDTQNNKILPSEFQTGSGGKTFGSIPTTTTGYANVNQNSSSTPAKDAYNSFALNIKRAPTVVHGYGGGQVVGDYEKKPFKDKLTDLKSNILSSIKDPNLQKKAEVLFNDVHKNIAKESLPDIIEQFDKRWQNVEADKLVNFVPTKDTHKMESAFTNFAKNTAAGSTITNPQGEPTGFNPDEDYTFSGLVVGKDGVSINMRNVKNPQEVFKIHNKSNVGANTIGVDRNNLKTIGEKGKAEDNKILSGLVNHLYGEKGKDYKFKVIADPDSPTLSSVILLDENNRIVEENIPEEVLDNITLQSVAISMGSSGQGNTPLHIVK